LWNILAVYEWSLSRHSFGKYLSVCLSIHLSIYLDIQVYKHRYVYIFHTLKDLLSWEIEPVVSILKQTWGKKWSVPLNNWGEVLYIYIYICMKCWVFHFKCLRWLIKMSYNLFFHLLLCLLSVPIFLILDIRCVYLLYILPGHSHTI